MSEFSKYPFTFWLEYATILVGFSIERGGGSRVKSNVRRVIDQRGVRLTWLADKLEISLPYLSLLLSGAKPWTAVLRDRAAIWLGVPEDILFSDLEGKEKLPEAEQEPTPEEAPQ